MTDADVTISATQGQISQMLTETALKSGNAPFHDDIYLQFHDDRVESIVSKSQNAVLTYTSFYENYFDELTVPGDDPVEAVWSVSEVEDYLGLVADSHSDSIKMQITGEAENGLAEHLRLDGSLWTEIKLPQAGNVLERVPMNLPDRWENNVFHSPSGNEPSTFINTTVSQLDKIQQAVDLDDDCDYPPIAVKDEQFILQIGEEGKSRSSIGGTLNASNVEGADVTNSYNRGFDEIIGTLSSEVNLQTAPGAPMAVVKEHSNRIIRHVLSPVQSESE